MSSPLVEITHRVEFSSSHRLRNPDLSEEENRRVFGMCYERHGHNYVLEVTVAGPVHAETGMVMNLLDLMGLVREQVLAEVDHKDLNDAVPFMQGRIPTAENLAVAIWDRLAPDLGRFEGCQLQTIRLFESRDNLVEYRGPR